MIELTAASSSNSENHRQWFYNGMDSLITREILDKMLPLLDENTSNVYSFERGLQAPALEMMLRGILIDETERVSLTMEFQKKFNQLEDLINTFANAVWGKDLNPRSPQQLKSFFFEHMKIPPITISQKGERKISTNREALEKLLMYHYARPIANAILQSRDMGKLLTSLKAGVDADNRMRTSYKIAGTDTGRWSSSENAFGTGLNIQNQTERVRSMYVSDPGMKLAYVDLTQAESRLVALISGDDAYWAACHSGDLHTTVAKMIWKTLPWPGTPKGDRALADELFYREFSRRDLSKRGGHGTNYGGTPPTMARFLKIEVRIMQDFREEYFAVFSGIPQWHLSTSRDLTVNGQLITPLGRFRRFFGRLDDDTTLRSAIAFGPQSSVGDILNIGLWRVWKLFPQVQLLAQVHDAILFQYPEHLESTLIPQICKAMEVEVTYNGRTLIIPAEASVGWNWGKFDKKNPDKNPLGLKGYSHDGDGRHRPERKAASLLDCRIS